VGKTSFLNYFLLPHLLFLFLGIFFFLFYEKGSLVLFLNENSTPFLDVFFKYFTDLGLGGFFAIPIIIALFIRYEYAIMGAISLLMTGILTSIFKQLLFKGMPRPTAYFTQGELSLIEGVDYNSYNTFPSGHTMAAFAMFLFISFLVNRKGWIFFFFLLALGVGFSRVYLSQHFFVDIYVGSILGVFAVYLGYILGCKVLGNRYLGLKNKIKLK